jgi:hypothetical protein
MHPEVVYLILCEEVRQDPSNPQRLLIDGLLLRLRSSASPPFPFVCPRFRILLLLTGYQGSGELLFRLVQADTRTTIYQTQPVQITFANPNAIGRLVFDIDNCEFPAAGVYWLYCHFSGYAIAQQSLWVSD